MTYQLEVNIVYANQGGGLLGHMYVNLNDANGVKVASYGFNPEGGMETKGTGVDLFFDELGREEMPRRPQHEHLISQNHVAHAAFWADLTASGDT